LISFAVAFLLAVPVLSHNGDYAGGDHEDHWHGHDHHEDHLLHHHDHDPAQEGNEGHHWHDNGSVVPHHGGQYDHPLPHDHNSMRTHTHIAYHHVESACAADVERLCPLEQPAFPPLGDPFLEWLLLPMDLPSPIEFDTMDMTTLINQMMDSALAAPVTFSLVIIGDSEPVGDNELIEDSEPTPFPPHAEEVVDAFVSKMAQEQPEEIPLLAQQFVQHGHQVLEQDDLTEERRHLARRLTEVRLDQMHHSVHLPFGCPRNRCLIAASQEGRVSETCMAAMNQLQQVNLMEVQLEQQQEVLSGLMWIYVCLLLMLVFLLGRRYSLNKGNLHLKLRILKAVYSNPSIKAQLEEDLGESVGNVPPVSAHALHLMSAGGKALSRKLQLCRRVHFLFFMILLSLVFIAPFLVLPICIVVLAVRVGILCCAPAYVRQCTCCCCGVSTEDVSNGLVTDAQACCNCCVGTGVCSPACASCCGKDGCCCGSEDCSCCNAAQPKIAKCCGCCCCGATPKQVTTGTLTAEQVGCCCCSGTGCCSGGSCSCGDAARKGRGQKHVFKAKQGIYHGVPIQVV
jgi:hypothetical protein